MFEKTCLQVMSDEKDGQAEYAPTPLTFFQSNLIILRPTDFSIKFDTLKSEWSIVYIEGPKVIISKDIVILALKINLSK